MFAQLQPELNVLIQPFINGLKEFAFPRPKTTTNLWLSSIGRLSMKGVNLMAFAKTIDRLEFTRRRFAKQLGLDEPPQKKKESQESEHGLETCPHCGSKALRLDGGCMSCLSCGWSACHNS